MFVRKIFTAFTFYPNYNLQDFIFNSKRFDHDIKFIFEIKTLIA